VSGNYEAILTEYNIIFHAHSLNNTVRLHRSVGEIIVTANRGRSERWNEKIFAARRLRPSRVVSCARVQINRQIVVSKGRRVDFRRRSRTFEHSCGKFELVTYYYQTFSPCYVTRKWTRRTVWRRRTVNLSCIWITI